MGRELINGPMEENTSDSILMIRNKDMEGTIGLMGDITKGNG